MLPIFLIILGHTSYGITNTLWKNPRNVLGTLPLIIIRSFFSFTIFIISYFFLVHNDFLVVKSFTKMDLIKTFAICSVNYFGLFFFLKSLKYTQISNAIGFSKIGLIIGVIIAYIFYHDEVTFIKIFACLLIFLSTLFIEKSEKRKNEKLSKGLIFTVLSRIFWSTAFFFVPFINKLGALLFCSVLEFTVFMMSVFLFLVQNQKINFENINKNIKIEIIFLIFLGIVGTLSLNYAIANISIVVFAFMGLIEPVIGLLISKFYHHEKLNYNQIIGISIALFSAFLLSIFPS